MRLASLEDYEAGASQTQHLEMYQRTSLMTDGTSHRGKEGEIDAACEQAEQQSASAGCASARTPGEDSSLSTCCGSERSEPRNSCRDSCADATSGSATVRRRPDKESAYGPVSAADGSV